MLVDGLLDFSTMDLTLGDYTAEGPAAVTALRAVTGLHVEERTGRSEQGEGLRDFDLSLDFDELVGSRRFGPGEAVLEVRNIDSAAIQGFQAAMKAIDAQALDELETNMQKMAAFEEWAPRILGPSPLLQLERLKMSSEEGEVRASFRVGVDASDPSMLGNPFIVLALVDAELDLGMPVPLVTSLLAGRHFCAGPPAPRPIHGMVPARPDPPFAQPVMVPFIGGYQLDTSLADQPEASVLATLGSAGFECRTMRAKLVDDTILVQKGDRYVLNARLQSGMPMLNGAPANPALFAGLVPGM
jgi:hypothetical protein